MGSIDDQLATKRKKQEAERKNKIADLKGQWKILLVNPITWGISLFAIIALIAWEYYWYGEYKQGISIAFNWLISSILTLLITKIIEFRNK